MKTLTFIFDFLSPYSYQAWTWLRDSGEYLAQNGCQLEFRPVVMSKVIKSHDTKGPAEIEHKRNFLFKDCLRWAAINKIPFKLPSHFPFNPLGALRFCCVGNPKQQEEKISFFFCLAWEKGIALDDEQQVSEAMAKKNWDFSQFTQISSSKEARALLRQNTQWAIEKGLFGVPTFWIEKQRRMLDWFWGRDSIPHLKLFIEGKDPLPDEEYQRYLALFSRKSFEN